MITFLFPVVAPENLHKQSVPVLLFEPFLCPGFKLPIERLVKMHALIAHIVVRGTQIHCEAVPLGFGAIGRSSEYVMAMQIQCGSAEPASLFFCSIDFI